VSTIMPNDPSTQPEGASRPVRRRFSDRDKLRILDAADRCTRPGEVWINRPEQEPANHVPQAAAS
jgi:Ni,Fe-hydrogenase maturation factor